MSTKPILYFVVQHFQSGGAERVASILINALQDRGYKIYLETDVTKPFNYEINKRVELIPIYNLPTKSKISKFIKIRRILQRRAHILKYRPDVIISFLPSSFFESKIATLGIRVKHIASDHTAMDRDLGKWINYLRQHFYKYADKVTVLTQKDQKLISNKLHNTEVVYNPLTFDTYSNIADKKKIILCVGRIESSQVKGFDRILEIWGQIYKKYPEWSLKIAGTGDAKAIEFLEGIALHHGLNPEDIFLGQVKDIVYKYREAAIFALSSRVEGFPMVLTEAMSQGCACITFDLNGAAAEILKDENSGLIIRDNDCDAFKEKLELLMKDKGLRNIISTNAYNNVSCFNTDSFISKWETLISNVLC